MARSKGKRKLGVAFIYPEPPLGDFTDVMQCSLQKQTPPQPSAGWGLLTDYFGASPVATALDLRTRRDPGADRVQLSTHLSQIPVQQDISTWPVTGHFYLALTDLQTLYSVQDVLRRVTRFAESQVTALQRDTVAKVHVATDMESIKPNNRSVDALSNKALHKKWLTIHKGVSDLREELADTKARLNRRESQVVGLIENGLSLSFRKEALECLVASMARRDDYPPDTILGPATQSIIKFQPLPFCRRADED